MGHAVHAQDSPVTCRDVRTNAAQQVLRGTHRRHARRVLAGAREAPAGGCSSGGRGSDGKCTLLINRSVVTSPSSLRTSTSAQIAQTAERQLCSRRGLTGDADAAARTAPVGRDGMCTPASRLGPQGGSGRGEQAKVTFGPVLSYPAARPFDPMPPLLRPPGTGTFRLRARPGSARASVSNCPQHVFVLSR